jgi:hypothetical protein
LIPIGIFLFFALAPKERDKAALQVDVSQLDPYIIPRFIYMIIFILVAIFSLFLLFVLICMSQITATRVDSGTQYSLKGPVSDADVNQPMSPEDQDNGPGLAVPNPQLVNIASNTINPTPLYGRIIGDNRGRPNESVIEEANPLLDARSPLVTPPVVDRRDDNIRRRDV